MVSPYRSSRGRCAETRSVALRKMRDGLVNPLKEGPPNPIYPQYSRSSSLETRLNGVTLGATNSSPPEQKVVKFKDRLEQPDPNEPQQHQHWDMEPASSGDASCIKHDARKTGFNKIVLFSV